MNKESYRLTAGVERQRAWWRIWFKVVWCEGRKVSEALWFWVYWPSSTEHVPSQYKWKQPKCRKFIAGFTLSLSWSLHFAFVLVSYLLLSLSHTVFVFSVDLLCVAARLNWPRTLSAQSLQSLCGTNWKNGNEQTFQKREKLKGCLSPRSSWKGVDFSI